MMQNQFLWQFLYYTDWFINVRGVIVVTIYYPEAHDFA